MLRTGGCVNKNRYHSHLARPTLSTLASLPLPRAEVAGATSARRRAYWLKTLYRWHWLSSAACLVALLAFAATGLTLNHAGAIESRPRVDKRSDRLPVELLTTLRGMRPDANAPLPSPVVAWLTDHLDLRTRDRPGEWSDKEVYVALPRPGGDAWVSIALASGAVQVESTDRGWVAYFNDLHKGRNTGPAWSWFIDVFAVACLMFALTGLCLLWLHGRSRPSTWPMVGLGVVLPLVIAILFIH